MRKLVQMLVMLSMIVFATQVAFAASDKETIEEGADLTSIHRLAVATPKYYPVGEEAPTLEELTKIIYDGSKGSHCDVLSYTDVANGINKDDHLNIKVLDAKKAEKAFKEHVAKYADAYVETWVANNSGTTCFFSVYKAGTDELLYVYQIQAGKWSKGDAKTYLSLSEQFYKHFEHAVTEQQKKNEKG